MKKDLDIRDAFFNEVHKIMGEDKNVYFLTADMGTWGLESIRKDYPDRFINVGIAEQNMINVAAGMALNGKIVFCYSICAFLIARAYDQIRVNVAGMCLPICLVGSGPGLLYGSDGFTHHATFDVGCIWELPNINIGTPSNAYGAECDARAFYKRKAPFYIRLTNKPLPQRYGKYEDKSVNTTLTFRSQRYVGE